MNSAADREVMPSCVCGFGWRGAGRTRCRSRGEHTQKHVVDQTDSSCTSAPDTRTNAMLPTRRGYDGRRPTPASPPARHPPGQHAERSIRGPDLRAKGRPVAVGPQLSVALGVITARGDEEQAPAPRRVAAAAEERYEVFPVSGSERPNVQAVTTRCRRAPQPWRPPVRAGSRRRCRDHPSAPPAG